MARPRTARWRAVALLAAACLGIAVLASCAPEGGVGDPGSTGSPGSTASPGGEPTSTPSPSPTVSAQIPDDCREMLIESVLAQLKDVPLNDPAFGPSGALPDGTLVCIWADPAADTTNLRTTITTMSRGPALDLLNELAETEGFTCYTPDGGTRCEKTWFNETYPVVDGRTLFWRDDILIDTQYSNLAPEGYTGAIVAHIWG